MKMRFDTTTTTTTTTTTKHDHNHFQILLQCMKLQIQSKGNTHASVVEGYKESSIVLNGNGYHRSADSCCDRWGHIDPSLRSPSKEPFTENEDQIIINHIISIGNIIITSSLRYHHTIITLSSHYHHIITVITLSLHYDYIITVLH